MAGIGQAMAGPAGVADRIADRTPGGSARAAEATAAPRPTMPQGTGSPDSHWPADDGPDETPNVSPEEQAQYDAFVGNGRRLVYDDRSANGVNPDILASLRATDDPVQDLAVTAASLVTGLIENAAAAGRRIDPDIAFHGGVELLEDLADLADAARIHDFREKELEAAMYRAMDIVLKNNPGAMVDQVGAERQFGDLMRQDRAGTLAQAMPALAGAIGKPR
jgi:hypothetical protein